MQEVRVRFAPSPTGFVHVGSLRTALYNYLFARHNKGKFILRIEDTDQSRFVEGAVESLIKALSWAGLDYDEGPEKEGAYGPYYQSQRLDIYKEHIDYLIEKGWAYPCFCSAERLDNMRKEQAARNEAIMYDGACRNIPAAEANQRMKSESCVIRLKVPQKGETIVDDLIRGKVSFQNNLIDDQALIKSDGYPTYHLANVVDDHLMKVSHVIRGEEWLPSTPKHILLYQAFGWEAPQFAHLPLLLNADRSKLSKRQGDVSVEDYQVKGILPQALINFISLLGWSKGDDQEIFTLDESIEYFTLERVNKAGAVFDIHKLEWMNGMYIRSLPEDEYVKIGLEWLERENLDTGDADKNKALVLSLRNGINKFNEIKERAALFFTDRLTYSEDAAGWIVKEESKILFQKMYDEIDQYPDLTLDDFKVLMKTVQKETGIKGKELWMPVRAAITGLTEGPELPVVISVLGKEKVKKFIKQAIDK